MNSASVLNARGCDDEKVVLTGALLETGGRLLQVSTDFVFNGSQGSPYRPEQAS